MPKRNDKPKQEPRESYSFPWFHRDVLNAVSEISPEPRLEKRPRQAPDEDYSTFVMATFKCVNADCSKEGWSSKKVTFLIRRYPNNGYNAIVFNQHCKSCDELGVPWLDRDSYVERVAYRLKKWAGVRMDTRPIYNQRTSPPHRKDLCEGCKRGICRENGGAWQNIIL